MIYVKSVVAGIAAVLAAFVIVVVAAFVLSLPSLMSGIGAGSGGIGAVSAGFFLPAVLVVALMVFAGGFYWEFRRASRPRS